MTSNKRGSGRPQNVLDIGCGWGQPAVEVAALWNAKIYGLTISRRQAEYVNALAVLRHLPIIAKVADVELMEFDDLGTFDVVMLYEVLEHIADRPALLKKLHRATHAETRLLVAVNCNSGEETVYSEVQGVQPLSSVSETHAIFENSGWTILDSSDCTKLTIPVWNFWIDNLKGITHADWIGIAEALVEEFEALRRMYEAGQLRSLQIIAGHGRT